METKKQVNLVVERTRKYESETVGNLYAMNTELNGYDYDHSWFTLENSMKLMPVGVYAYRLAVTPKASKWYGKQSHIFKIDAGDDDSSGYQVHVGNSVEDTSGSILIGMELNANEDMLIGSLPAFNSLVRYLLCNGMTSGYIQVIENL